MAIDTDGPLGYFDSINLGKRKPGTCDGFCISCPEKNDCNYSKAKSLPDFPGSGYQNSGDSEFNSRVLNVEQFSSRYRLRDSDSGFSNPPGYFSENSPGFDYTQGSGSGGGFHGSYSGKDDYSKRGPKASSSNYCAGSSCGKK